jgi:hypothetical protein
LPNKEEVSIFVNQNFDVKAVLSSDDEHQIQLKAKEFLEKEQVLSAWKVLLAERI